MDQIIPRLWAGLNNQKQGLLAACLLAREMDVALALPDLLNWDNTSCPDKVKFDLIYDSYWFQQSMEQVGVRVSLSPQENVRTIPTGDLRRIWCESIQRLKNHALPLDDFHQSFFRALRLAPGLNDLVLTIVRTIRKAAEGDWMAVQLRCETDWMGYSVRKSKELDMETEEAVYIPASLIISKVLEIQDLPRHVYVACDFDNICEDVITPWGTAKTTWDKRSFLSGSISSLSIARAAIDFEVCNNSTCFVGTTRSSFAQLIAMSRKGRSFAYNLKGKLRMRTDHGLEVDASSATRKRMRVGVCAMLKDEESYLEDWLNHHRSIGFNHFFLYDNNSCPPINVTSADVTVLRWRYKFAGRQTFAYLHCCRKFADFDWIALIDVDEFIMLKRDAAICDLLARYDTDALALNWLCYGSSGHESRPRSHSSFTRYSSHDMPINRHVKSIVRPSTVTTTPQNPHLFPVRTCDELGRVVTSPFTDHSSTVAYIKHTITRSREEFAEKILRGGGNRNGSIYSAESFDDFQTYLNTLEENS